MEVYPIRCLHSCHINRKQRNSRGTCVSWAKRSCLSAGIGQKCSSVVLIDSSSTANLSEVQIYMVWLLEKIFQIKCFPSYLHPNLYSKWFVNKAASQRETAKDSNCLNYFKWYISGLLKCSSFFISMFMCELATLVTRRIWW